MLVLVVVAVLAFAAYWFLIRDDRSKVLLVGDSLMRQTAPLIEQGLGSDVNVRSEAINGTGLLSRNQYDWLAQLRRLADDFDPDVTVLSFNGNCTAPVGLDPAQPIACDSSEFFQQWGDAAERATQILLDHGSKVVWVTPPPEASDQLARRAKGIGTVYRDLAGRHREVVLVDGYKALADDNGNYQIKTTGPDGADVPLRAPDTVHFTEEGAKRFAFPILIAVTPLVGQ